LQPVSPDAVPFDEPRHDVGEPLHAHEHDNRIYRGRDDDLPLPGAGLVVSSLLDAETTVRRTTTGMAELGRSAAQSGTPSCAQ
jgi:hypothetical protein